MYINLKLCKLEFFVKLGNLKFEHLFKVFAFKVRKKFNLLVMLSLYMYRNLWVSTKGVVSLGRSDLGWCRFVVLHIYR